MTLHDIQPAVAAVSAFAGWVGGVWARAVVTRAWLLESFSRNERLRRNGRFYAEAAASARAAYERQGITP